ncbi:MAG: sporulation integral membrane protein YtvI [Eubacteriales bacterium]|nr:sporulation integral membrane protein YtvI [Eubacteriales bacterium]
MDQDLERKRRFLINAAYYALILIGIYVAFRYVIYAVTPFIIAALITFMLKRPIDGLSCSFNLPRRGTAGIVVLLFYIVLSISMTWAFTHLLWAVFNWLAEIPSHYRDSIEPAIENILNWYETRAESLTPNRLEYIDRLSDDILAKTSEIIIYVSEQAVKMAQNLAFSIPKFVIGAVFCIVATVFMSLDFPSIKHFILEQFSYNHQCILLESKKYVVQTFGKIITSYAAIMFITMTELYVGFMAIGVEDAMVMSLLIAMFDILPALGTGGIMIPWVIIEIINQNYTFAVQLFIVYAIVTIIRNFLEPKIVGDSIGLHPVIMLMSIFLGVSIFGPLGILIMPFMLIVIKRLNDTGRIHVFNSSYALEVEEPGFFELKRRGKLKKQARRKKEEEERIACENRVEAARKRREDKRSATKRKDDQDLPKKTESEEE